jgi:glycosyltransferase involved in cell wall biosynthesis
MGSICMRSVRDAGDDALMIDLRMYRRSGIGRYLQNLLPGVIPRLHAPRIIVLCNRPELDGEHWTSDTRIELRHFATGPFTPAEQLASMSGIYRDTRLLWVPQYNIPLTYRGTLMVTIYDLCQIVFPETLANGLQRAYARYLLSRVAARARAIFCISEFTAAEVQKYLNVGRDRLTVAYPSIANLWSSGPSLKPEPNATPYLLAVGNIKKHKNLRTLITAFDRIKERIPHDMVIVGQRSGFLNADNEFTDTDTLLGGRVRFTGAISDEQLTRYYIGAHGFVLPSYYEGFGFPAIEAMALGCPVACSGVASLPEVAGDAALFFDPFSPENMSQALFQIATDGELRKRLIERGLDRAERFRNDIGARETAAVINRIALEK